VAGGEYRWQTHRPVRIFECIQLTKPLRGRLQERIETVVRLQRSTNERAGLLPVPSRRSAQRGCDTGAAWAVGGVHAPHTGEYFAIRLVSPDAK